MQRGEEAIGHIKKLTKLVIIKKTALSQKSNILENIEYFEKKSNICIGFCDILEVRILVKNPIY